MFCPNCGNKLEDNSKFCSQCGAAQKFSEKNNVEVNAPEYVKPSGEVEIEKKQKDEELLKELKNAVGENVVEKEISDENITQNTTEIKVETPQNPQPPKYDNAIYSDFATKITSAPVPPPKPPVSEPIINQNASIKIPKKERKVLNVFLSIFLCIFGLITPAFFSVYDYFNNDLPVTVEKADIAQLCEDADLDLIGEIKYNIPESIKKENHITNSNIQKAVELAKYRELVDIYNGYIQAFKNGDEDYQIKPRNVVALIKDNESLIERRYITVLESDSYLNLQTRLENNYNWSQTSVHSILKNVNIAVWIPKVILASYPYIIAFALFLACFILIFVFNITRLKCLLLVSIPLLISGLAYTVFSFIISGLYNGRYSGFYKEFIAPLKSNLAVCGWSMLGLGVVFLGVYILIRKLISKKSV